MDTTCLTDDKWQKTDEAAPPDLAAPEGLLDGKNELTGQPRSCASTL
jgi:hypothetical protein